MMRGAGVAMEESQLARWVDRHWSAVESAGGLPGPGPFPWWAWAAGFAAGWWGASWAGVPAWAAAPCSLAAALALAEACWGARWARWAKARGGGEPWRMWIAARMWMWRFEWERARMLGALMGANHLRRCGASWLALPLEAAAVGRLDPTRACLERRSEALWEVKAKLDPARGKLECVAQASALSLAWGRGELSLAFAERLRRCDASVWLWLSPPSEALARLSWRWGALGEPASWRASRPHKQSDASAEAPCEDEALSFAEAFGLACAAYELSNFQQDEHWEQAMRAKGAYRAELEREGMERALGAADELSERSKPKRL